HPGTIACRADHDDIYISICHYEFETEANRFASELLLPTEWVKKKILQIRNIEQVFYELKRDAEVSFAVVRIKLIKCLCAGWVVAECTTSGEILKWEKSPGTPIELYLDYSDRSNPRRFFQAMADHSVEGFTVRRGATVIRWWRLDSRESL